MILSKRKLSTQVVDYLLNLMKTGRVAPGDKLPTEKVLTETLGVSRTCVREAMRSLESLDLITVRPKVGAVVKEPSPASMFRSEHLAPAAYRQQSDLLIEFRRILEVGLASLAAQKAEPEDFDAMQKALDEHAGAIARQKLAYQADIDFHMAIARASKNPFAMMVFQGILEPLTKQRMKTNLVPEAAEEGLRDHKEILQAIKAHNKEQAREAMRKHMDTAEHYWLLAQGQPADDRRQPPVVKANNGPATLKPRRKGVPVKAGV